MTTTDIRPNHYFTDDLGDPATCTEDHNHPPKLQSPADYTPGRSELCRAYRRSMGLSRLGFALKLGISRRSYQRLELSEADMPPGFIDSMKAVKREFDDRVDALAKHAEECFTADDPWFLHVSDEARYEWDRCLVNAAALRCDLIIPMNAVDVIAIEDAAEEANEE